MIELKTLTQILQDKLNNRAVELGYDKYHFYIHTDTGDFKKPDRINNEVTEYINGIMTELSSDLNNLSFSPSAGDTRIRYGVENCSTQIIVPLPNFKEDKEYKGEIRDGQTSVLEKVRKIIDDVAQNTELETIEVDGVKFRVSTTITLANSGIRDMVNEVGDSFTYSIYISYLFTQNGINSRDMIYYLDDKVIPYEAFTESRVATSDNNVYADTKNGETEAMQLQTIWNLNFELPLTEAFKDYYNFLTDGEINTIHILSTGSTPIRRKVVFIDNTAFSGQGLANVGSQLKLVNARARYDLVRVPELYKIYRVKKASSYIWSSSFVGYGFKHKRFYYSSIISQYFILDDIIITQATLDDTIFELVRG